MWPIMVLSQIVSIGVNFISIFVSFTEFDLSSFCKYITPSNFSQLRHLRLDANNITHSSMPVEYPTCLRRATDIMFE